MVGLDRYAPHNYCGVKVPTRSGGSLCVVCTEAMGGWGLKISRSTQDGAESFLGSTLGSLEDGILPSFPLPPLSCCLASPGCVYWELALSWHQKPKLLSS